MATYLSTSSVGNYDYAETTGALTGLPLYNAISNNNTPEQKAAINTTLSREDAIIDQLQTKFGVPYPFDSAGAVVDQLSGVGYVLEVQSKIHFPTRNVGAGTLAHETTHQWFGDSVTGPTWHDLWLHEGWATWAAWWWGNAFNGSANTTATQFTNNYTQGNGTCPGSNKWCTAPTGVDGASLFNNFPTYTRPAMMFEAQNQIMGATAFQNLITQWQTRYAYGNAGRAQWIALTKEMDGNTRDDRWDQFFSQWLDGTTMPTINPGNFDTP
jgi:aminopeptidase N